MKKIAVLGAGMVGSEIAGDLCKDFEVISADIDKAALDSVGRKYSVETLQADLKDPESIKKIVSDVDIVACAVPGVIGFDVFKSVIKCKKDIADISFFDHDALEADSLAKENNVTAIVDCGVAPGMTNMLLGCHYKKMNVKNFRCYVGGLPAVRTLPYQYKAPFSPIDVIAEYTRPVKIIENGRQVTKPALSDLEKIEFEGVGTLEAFNTDGLRTIVKTMPVANMYEKTMRYPGHANLMETLRDSGFFDEQAVTVQGISVRPIDLTSKLLFPKWKYKEDEEDFTAMKAIVEGEENGTPAKYTYTLLDRFDKAGKVSSMARTTGYTCAAAVRLISDGIFSQKGVCPPEYLGADEKCFKFILDYLKQRNVIYHINRQ